MNSSGGGFFNCFPSWGGGGGGGGHQGGGAGRGGNHPNCQLQGPGGLRVQVSFEEAAEYNLANNGRDYYGMDNYPLRCAFSNAGYEARRNSIFQPDGTHPLVLILTLSWAGGPHPIMSCRGNKAWAYPQQ
jgi:hypothetical protein